MAPNLTLKHWLTNLALRRGKLEPVAPTKFSPGMALSSLMQLPCRRTHLLVWPVIVVGILSSNLDPSLRVLKLAVQP